MVPRMMLPVCDPANPLTILSVGTSSDMKSSMRCDIVAVHLLSIPIGSESVSKMIQSAIWPASADMAIAEMASRETAVL